MKTARAAAPLHEPPRPALSLVARDTTALAED